MRKSELMILWNVESWTVEPHGVYFVARQLVADEVANHEDHTIAVSYTHLNLIHLFSICRSNQFGS